MKTICASVNKRLLTRANRLFTGRLSGRIIEILQNARRAGATRVEITNQDRVVTVQDNGRGIDDFSTLLDLGGSAWDETLESSEDPCGVGLFCLAPREVTVRSNGQRATLTAESWTGTPVPILDDPEPVMGTLLQFQDETWDTNAVELHAVFSRMQVTVNGKPCPNVRFVSDSAVAYPDLGCSIEVRESQDLDSWHRTCERRNHYGQNALINFHGQIVGFDFHGVGEQGLHFLVEMTGEPTGLRLMLPARTRIVENEVFEILKSALEVEAYRYLQRRGHHRLPYKEYLRAKELGVDLPEATPTFTAGLLWQGCAGKPARCCE